MLEEGNTLNYVTKVRMYSATKILHHIKENVSFNCHNI